MIPDHGAPTAVWRHWPGWANDLTAALAVLLGGGVLFGVGLHDVFGGPHPGPMPMGPGPVVAPHLLGLAFTVVAAALMFLRRHRPLTVFAATTAVLCAGTLLAIPTLGSGIAAVVAAYTLLERRSQRWVLVSAAVAGCLIALLSMFDLGHILFDGRIGVAILLAAAIGESARSRREYLRVVEERAERAEQTREAEARRRVSEERLRIAQELHDTVAHQLSVINLHAGVASGALDARPERAEEALGTIRQAARGALAEIGELLRYLRDEEMLGAAPPQQGLEALGALLQRMRDAGLEIDADIAADLSRVDGRTGNVAYRVVQEGLTNAHKHGGKGAVELHFGLSDEELTVRIENRLPEEIRETGEASSGLGLTGIRERVAVLHGSASTELRGGRYCLEVRLPLHQGEETR